ncbi:Uncharacterised protein PB.8751, partial [Pycnogonum litorale]
IVYTGRPNIICLGPPLCLSDRIADKQMEQMKNRAEKLKQFLSSVIIKRKDGVRCVSSDTMSNMPEVLCSSSVSDSWSDFSYRVSTFCKPNNIFAWFMKPPELSPIQCARYGWILHSDDAIRCITCQKMISAKIPPPEDGLSLYHQCVKSVAEDLKNGHLSCCPWPSNHTPESFLSVCHLNREDLINCLVNAVHSLTTNSYLPPIDQAFLEKDVQESLRKIQDSLFADISDEVFLLAVTGWTLRHGPDKFENFEYLKCERCFHSVGICSFKSGSLKSEDELSSTPDIPSRERTCLIFSNDLPGESPKNSECEAASDENLTSSSDINMNAGQGIVGSEPEFPLASDESDKCVDQSNTSESQGVMDATVDDELSSQNEDISKGKDDDTVVVATSNEETSSDGNGEESTGVSIQKTVNSNGDEQSKDSTAKVDDVSCGGQASNSDITENDSNPKSVNSIDPESDSRDESLALATEAVQSGQKRKFDSNSPSIIKRIKLADSFNPIYEHKPWCPWIKPDDLDTDNKFNAGWTSVVHLLLQATKDAQSPILSPKFKDRWIG